MINVANLLSDCESETVVLLFVDLTMELRICLEVLRLFRGNSSATIADVDDVMRGRDACFDDDRRSRFVVFEFVVVLP